MACIVKIDRAAAKKKSAAHAQIVRQLFMLLN